MSPHPDRTSGRRGGFTLIELMVALVIGSLIIGVVLQFVTGQTRFASVQTAREEVQQNARGALEVVSSDLRGALASGIILAEDDALEFMLPRRWGVVCGIVAGDIVAAFPNLAGETMPAGVGVGLMTFTAGVWRPALPDVATVISATPVLTTANPGCGTQRIEGDVVAFSLAGANLPPAVAGDRIAVYQRVKYEVADGPGGDWLYRSNGVNPDGTYNMQPLAGPVDRAEVGFRYFDGPETGAPALIAAPGAGAAAEGVRMIRLRVRMTSRQVLDGQTSQVEQDSATVQIRN